MSGLVNALAIFAVVVLVIVRQFRAQRISADRRWWILPAVLGFIALREPGVIDPHHQAEAIFLLGAELLIGLATGAGWAWTTRIWTAPDGSVWGKGTRASVVVWGVGIGLRVGLFGIGVLLGVDQDATAMVLLALAATLLVRSGILVWRSQSLHPASRQGAAYGDGVAQAPWKERV
ncbi:DUF1453 domain-containing protein [Streptomyces sp. NPDC058256]|uniref:DUF1453 domain-containing protein n=1 Tax=Streptomyces sp. NPDC058256 TaxID=3346408 RepID=UPI0036EE4F9E